MLGCAIGSGKDDRQETSCSTITLRRTECCLSRLDSETSLWFHRRSVASMRITDRLTSPVDEADREGGICALQGAPLVLSSDSSRSARAAAWADRPVSQGGTDDGSIDRPSPSGLHGQDVFNVPERRLPADRLVVGTGIEPATSSFMDWCSTRLS